MRVAPVGLLASRDDALRLGSEIAALTHGHPSGHLSAGFLAATIALVRDGEELGEALDETTAEVQQHGRHEETLRAVRAARNVAAQGPPKPRRDWRSWAGDGSARRR